MKKNKNKNHAVKLQFGPFSNKTWAYFSCLLPDTSFSRQQREAKPGSEGVLCGMNRGARRSEQTRLTWVRCHPRCSWSRALAATRFCMDSSLCLPILLSTIKSPLRCWEERALPADSARFPSTSLSRRLLSCKQQPEPPQTHADVPATARAEAQGKRSPRPASSETLFPLPRQSGWLPTGLGWEDTWARLPSQASHLLSLDQRRFLIFRNHLWKWKPYL